MTKKKVSFLLTALMLGTTLSFAQQKGQRRFEEIKDGEYTIRMIPGPGDTYGFDILRGDKLIIHQPSPFQQVGGRGPGIKGLKKADTEKVARYLVKEARRTGGIPAPFLPERVAKELNIQR